MVALHRPSTDRIAASALSMQETDILAVPDGAQTRVRFLLQRHGNDTLSGRISVELIRLEDAAVVTESDAPFELDARTKAVDVRLDYQISEDHPEILAGYVLRYRVEWSGDPLYGRRSVFAALDVTETQLLAPDTLRLGGETYARLIARRASDGAPRANLPVTVTLAQPQADGPDGDGDGEGEPVEMVRTMLFEGRTDAFGQIAVPLAPDEARVGEGVLEVDVSAPGGAQALRADVAIERSTKVLLTTDKPIYQPGQVIHLRALALRRPNLEPDADQPLVFEVFDGKENKVGRVQVETDAFGIASDTFQLASEVNMGVWRIVARIGDAGDSTEKTVTVDRYALPKFDLDLQLDRGVYLAGDHVEGNVVARYFFGQPVAGGVVSLVASTHDAGETVFAEIQGATDGEGGFRFEFDLPDYVVGHPLAQGGGLVELELTVTDAAGQLRQVARTLRVAPAALDVAVVPESGALAPGLRNRLIVRCVDAAGAPAAAHHRLRLPGIADVELDTGVEGMAVIEVMIPEVVEGGIIDGELESRDGDGHVVSRTFTLTVDVNAPSGVVLVRTDRALYRVGDTLMIDVLTIGAPDRVFLDVIRAGQTVRTETLVPDADGLTQLAMELSPDHAGALQIDAYYLALGSSLQRDAKWVYVESADALHIEIEADEDVYRPGDQATLGFRVTDDTGTGRAAAIGLQIVDEAVFGLVEFRPGLEKVFFRIEGELGEPTYQIGHTDVPSLASLASDPAASEDSVRQDEAALLFAASGDAAPYPIAINTWTDLRTRALDVLTPIVGEDADRYLARLHTAAQRGDLTRENIAERLEAGFAASYDAWGQRLNARIDTGTSLVIASRGPDEMSGTSDDVSVSYEVDCDVFDQCARNDGPDDQFEWDNDGAGPPFAGGGDPVAEEPSADGDGEADRPRVRREFPETLFVEPSLITDGTGVAELVVPLADSITTWRLTAMANSMAGELGSTESGMRVFQPFFVDVAFPATLTRGDEYEVPIALYNYLEVPQTVVVSIEPVTPDAISLLGPSSFEVALDPGEVRGVRMPVRVERVGVHGLTVYAEGDTARDAVERTVLVEPDGQKVEDITSGRLDGPIEKLATLPAEVVEGSGKLLVKIYPGLFSSVVEGLDGILQMPSGCFEQTSSTTWPNVLVTRYLRDTGTVGPELEARATEYVHTGYQRLLTFEVDGGGFEWFGNDPAHVVLTAYGLLEFSDMALVRPVDANMIARTRAWLLAQQQADGHWENATRGLDETGQLNDPTTVTAYTAFALAAAGENGAALDRARTYLEARLDGMGTYTLALTANFLVAYTPNAALTARVVEELAGRVEDAVENEGPAQHWQTDEQTTTYGRGVPAFIETTALATHALLAHGSHGHISQPALDWIVAHKSPRGTWGSTAGTVWSIKCLLEAMRGGQDADADATITVTLDGVERASFRVRPETSDVMRQADLSAWWTPGQPQAVGVTLAGEGNLQYAIVEQFHVPWPALPANDGPLHIDVAYDRTQLAVDDTVTVNVVVTNDAIEYADMVMVDLGIPPGFDLQRADLDALVGEAVFSRYEATPRRLLLYFTVIRPENPVEFSYRIVARDPIRAQAPASRVYSYYNPEVEAEAAPVEVEVVQ